MTSEVTEVVPVATKPGKKSKKDRKKKGADDDDEDLEKMLEEIRDEMEKGGGGDKKEKTAAPEKAKPPPPEKTKAPPQEKAKAPPVKNAEKAPKAAPAPEPEGDGDNEGGEQETAASKKKQKKKAKKGEEKKEEKKEEEDEKKETAASKKKKKHIAAIQEALNLAKELERKRLEEEERKRQEEEEAERVRLEKLRLEQERKEKKKQREKERKERLKAEGKLLTKTQKNQKARAMATLEALRAQGYDVPKVGEKRETGGCAAGKKGKKKDEVKEETQDGEEKEEEAASADEQTSEDDDDSVPDAWDLEISEPDTPKTPTVNHEEIKLVKPVEKPEVKPVVNSVKKVETNELDTKEVLRSPIVCVLGHVDTGKTKLLDHIRKTHVQDGEAGGITQQIGATEVPAEVVTKYGRAVKDFEGICVPGLVIIDTPGHESFSNLRSRGSSLCDIAILVVDIMHGLEAQTIESINLLRQKKTPFVVALNKIDRLFDWKTAPGISDIRDILNKNSHNTKQEFDRRTKEIIVQFAELGLNAALFHENTDTRKFVSMVPTSAVTGEGVGNLLCLIVNLTQTVMRKRVTFSEELQATVLEVKVIPGLGTTIDAILVNGRLREGDTIVFAGYDGPVVTQIRSILMPQPLKDLRVKNPYIEHKDVTGAQGIKITGKDLDKAIAGLRLLVAKDETEIETRKNEVASDLKQAITSFKLSERGVHVQASTLGSLEALLEFLRTSQVPYSSVRIGPVVKKDIIKTSAMLELEPKYALVLAFDVKVEKDAQELADHLGIKIFSADIIYHLFDKFTEHQERLAAEKKEQMKPIAVFPCRLRVLPQFIFNSRDPIVVGVAIEAGILKQGTPLCVPSKSFLEIGTVTAIEVNHKPLESARPGQDVCIKIEPIAGESPKMYGRHFDHTDHLVSKITRQSIDACKECFRDDLQKSDWQLMIDLKKLFEIL